MVPLLVAALRDDRFYLSAPEFCLQSPAATSLICKDAPAAYDNGLVRSGSLPWPMHLSHILFPVIAPAKGRAPAVMHIPAVHEHHFRTNVYAHSGST